MRLSPSSRIKAYRAAAGLGPTSEMGHERRFERGPVTSAIPLSPEVLVASRHVSNVPKAVVFTRERSPNDSSFAPGSTA
jgi:hypothetical protein